MSFFAEYLSASAVRRSTPVFNIDQGAAFPQTLPSNADSVIRFTAIQDSAVSSLCVATLARSTIVSSPPLPRLRSRRFFEVRS
jgi:hypothetical protein